MKLCPRCEEYELGFWELANLRPGNPTYCPECDSAYSCKRSRWLLWWVYLVVAAGLSLIVLGVENVSILGFLVAFVGLSFAIGGLVNVPVEYVPAGKVKLFSLGQRWDEAEGIWAVLRGMTVALVTIALFIVVFVLILQRV